MKKIVLIFCVASFAVNIAFAQTEDWVWSRRDGGNDYDAASSVATDAAGHIFVTGYFKTASIVMGSDTLINSGYPQSAMFLARYDDLGNVVWARCTAGTSADQGNSVVTDPDGNLFVGGSYYSPVMDFGSGVTITNAHTHSEVFIAKYSIAGQVAWAKTGNCDGNDYQYAVASDIYGNAYLCGSYNGTYLAFDNDTIFNTGNGDSFLAKFNAAGSVQWVFNIGGTNNETARTVCTDAAGNIYLAGTFKDSVLTIGSRVLVNAKVGKEDIFIIKYDNNGNLIWAKRDGGVNADQVTCITADQAGHIYIVGLFSGTSITFGTTTLSGTNAFSDIYIAKYDTSGAYSWAKTFGGSSNDFTSMVTTDNSGDAYVAGWFVSPSINFGTTTMTNHNAGSSDILVVKFDAGGNVLWTKNPDGISDDWAYGITCSPSGSVYVTGSFMDSTITFGATPTLLNDSAQVLDIFLAKIDLTTGENENTFNGSMISIYPNPASNYIVVKKSSGFKDAHLEIYNLIGEKIIEEAIHGTSAIVNLNNVSQGMYFVNVNDGEGQYIQKFIVIK